VPRKKLDDYIDDILKHGTESEKKEAIAILKQLEKRKAGESFIDFIRATMPEFECNWHHKIIADRLSKLPFQSKQFVTISVAAQTGKSLLVSRNLPAWYLGMRPDARVLLVSYGTDFATTFNRSNQRLIEGASYKEIFPKTKINEKNMVAGSRNAKRTSDYVEIVGNSGFLRTVGIGAGSSGFSADLLIIDDPYPGMREALSKTYREMVWEWFTSVGLQRLSKKANVVILHTRWHHDDLIGRVQTKLATIKGLGKMETMRFPSIADDDLHPLDPRQPGESLWPSWKGDTEYLLAKKEMVGSFMFDAMEQQKPPKLAGGVIDTSKFQRFTSHAIPRDFDLVFTSWDLNYGETQQKSADYVCGYVIGYRAPHIYILGCYHGRYGFVETIEHMRQSQALWNASGILIEKKANGAAAINTLKNELSGVMAFEPGSRDKITRALACAPEINGGNIWLPLETWADDAITELSEFPEAEHDDRVDALTQAILWLRESKGKMGMKKLMDYYGGKL
jgi:predicted phage terminase large subunit-like protein